eukprot:CAMPEP_0179046058 /NCGR_PEP_ID=MMETSP0796-20121207/18495_1 /TAXON_ID=73915 /ORGANISM="Pyrodinium bahamense, Strain pbaha01" /LENGTH=572 /DNA_ID=CAMNT_0020742479 /DNA_START=94 /DNA_END=1815 /DNA_ORIENTATION=+
MYDNACGLGHGIRTVSGLPHEFDSTSTAWKATGSDPTARYLQGEHGVARFMIDTGLDADAGAGAPPASAGPEGVPPSCVHTPTGTGSCQPPPLPPTQTHASGIRRIATWLASAPSAGPGLATASRRARLQHEYQELQRQHRAERFTAEEIQSRLSAEMRELRDQCHEQGQTVGLLTHRLADARDAVTAELRAATTVRAALGGELMSEESQRRVLEAARRNEESEASSRIETSEKQLAMMRRVRASLEAQLRTSVLVQTELREHIAAERGGCSELEVAGERELAAWSAHNSRVQSELSCRLQAEREELESWRSASMREVTRFEQESEQHSEEESALLAELHSVREAQDKVRAQLQAEAALWGREVERLRDCVREADEECWQSLDTARRYVTAIGACGCERAELAEEVASAAAAQAVGAEFESLEDRRKGLLEELRETREAKEKCCEDGEVICRQRDGLVHEWREEDKVRGMLETELEALKKSRGILCWRRRQPAPSGAPLPPPEGPPPDVLRPHSPVGASARRQPSGKSSGRSSGSGGKGSACSSQAGYGVSPSGGTSSSNLADGAGGMRDEV